VVADMGLTFGTNCPYGTTCNAMALHEDFWYGDGLVLEAGAPYWTVTPGLFGFLRQFEPQGCPAPLRLSPSKVFSECAMETYFGFSWVKFDTRLWEFKMYLYGNGDYDMVYPNGEVAAWLPPGR
jgi:hypothetical protein